MKDKTVWLYKLYSKWDLVFKLLEDKDYILFIPISWDLVYGLPYSTHSISLFIIFINTFKSFVNK